MDRQDHFGANRGLRFSVCPAVKIRKDDYYVRQLHESRFVK